MPIILFVGVVKARQFYVDQKYLASLKWVLLEVIAPPEVEKSPKVAEHIFSALHAVYIPVKPKKKFFYGKIGDWFSFEIVGTQGEPHFYIRTLEGYKNLVETQIFAQYPNAEIQLVEQDYVNELPVRLPDDQYDVFGSEVIFSQPDAYPIKTHLEFEETSGGKEAETKRTDPLASIFELLSTLQGSEHLWIQFLIKPTSDVLKDKAKVEIDKLIGKKPKPQETFASKMVGSIDQLIPGSSVPGMKEENAKEPTMMSLTPGTRATIEAIEKKAGKLVYETTIRVSYVAPKESFNRAHISGLMGFFRQFNGPNSFKLDGDRNPLAAKGILAGLFPSDEGFFAAGQKYKRKWKNYRDYRKRLLFKKRIILNIEELATLWHLPGLGVRAPLFPRVDSKKGQPPPGLPMG